MRSGFSGYARLHGKHERWVWQWPRSVSALSHVHAELRLRRQHLGHFLWLVVSLSESNAMTVTSSTR